MMGMMFKKLTSRKLWMAIAGVAVGIAMGVGVDASDITTVSGGIISLISAISYIFMEGKIDANSASKKEEAK